MMLVMGVFLESENERNNIGNGNENEKWNSEGNKRNDALLVN